MTAIEKENNSYMLHKSKWENASVTAASAAGNDTEVQFNDGGVIISRLNAGQPYTQVPIIRYSSRPVI